MMQDPHWRIVDHELWGHIVFLVAARNGMDQGDPSNVLQLRIAGSLASASDSDRNHTKSGK